MSTIFREVGRFVYPIIISLLLLILSPCIHKRIVHMKDKSREFTEVVGRK